MLQAIGELFEPKLVVHHDYISCVVKAARLQKLQSCVSFYTGSMQPQYCCALRRGRAYSPKHNPCSYTIQVGRKYDLKPKNMLLIEIV